MSTKRDLHNMVPRSKKLLVLAVVLLHSVLIAAYTFPEALVPERARLWGQWYARPLFHQRWELFAPDPPLCSCALEARMEHAAWQALDPDPRNYLQRRKVQNLARHVQFALHSGDTLSNAVLSSALRMNFRPSATVTGAKADASRAEFRLVEHCVTDPQQPDQRTARVSPLGSR